MTDATLRASDTLLDAALDLPPEARERYVEANASPEVRAHVRRLLAAAEADDALLDAAPVTLAEVRSAVGRPGSSAVGETVGPYRITGLLGEGGMGRVYRAQRADGAFDRTVALKLVRRSLALAGADVAERLRRERAVLASLEHANIARLYDGGETEDGVPWVAMELVDGAPITEYADRRALGVRARVALAVEVSRAVEHAHRRLVVHRDLKPSNVFVAETEDGTPVVKLLDFGIARLLDVDVEGLTQTGTPVLTPEYAAPEQLRGGEVTTATDVWALGVLLHEVLAGQRPFRVDDARSQGSMAHLRSLDRALSRPLAPPSRGVAEAGRARQLRGDLDAIVLQALRPEPERRYASAGALADDLQRHLDGVLVLARPASASYRTLSFVRRHRGAVAAATAVTAALVVGLASSLVSLDRERAARAASDADVLRATAAVEFVTDMFGGSDGARLSVESSAGDLLAAGERRAAAIGAGREAERAVAYGALRDVYARLHHDDAALRAASEALRAARQAYGPGHPYTLDATRRYARHLATETTLDRALEVAETAADGYRALGAAGQAPLGQLLAQFGLLAITARDAPWTEARADIARRMLDEAEPLVRANRDSVALIDLLQGRASLVSHYDGVPASIPIYAESYQIQRALLGDSFEGFLATMNFGTTLSNAGDYEAAAPILDSAVAVGRRTVGPDHAVFPLLLSNASSVRLDRGRPGDVAQALAWTAEADRPGDAGGPWASWAATVRLQALHAAGRWQTLDDRAAQALATSERTGDTGYLHETRAQRAFARLALGDPAGARALAEGVIRDGSGDAAAFAHLALACIATRVGDADQARTALVAAQRALGDPDLPPQGLTQRLVRAGPAGGACDGWVSGS